MLNRWKWKIVISDADRLEEVLDIDVYQRAGFGWVHQAYFSCSNARHLSEEDRDDILGVEVKKAEQFIRLRARKRWNTTTHLYKVDSSGNGQSLIWKDFKGNIEDLS